VLLQPTHVRDPACGSPTPVVLPRQRWECFLSTAAGQSTASAGSIVQFAQRLYLQRLSHATSEQEPDSGPDEPLGRSPELVDTDPETASTLDDANNNDDVGDDTLLDEASQPVEVPLPTLHNSTFEDARQMMVRELGSGSVSHTAAAADDDDDDDDDDLF